MAGSDVASRVSETPYAVSVRTSFARIVVHRSARRLSFGTLARSNAMTGVELARAIHATYAGLPVIVVTGYGNREELKDFGETRILQKPYTEGELMEKITEALH